MQIEKRAVNTKLVLTGLIIGMFFSSLEQTLVGTAMPTIIGELNGFTIFAWVTAAHLIASTTVLPIVGKLSDLYGRRSIYLIGTIILTIGSFLCASATSMEQLIIYRGLQGIGSGMIMPLLIIGDIFTAEQRAKWQGVFGAFFGLSSVIGPVLGGLIVDHISWHWIFLINVPTGLLSAILIYIGLKHEAIQKTEKVNIDFLGIFTLIPGIVLLLLGLTFGGDKFEWISLESLMIFGCTLFFIVLFIIFERKAIEPILDLSLFKNRVFATTNILGFLLGLGMFGAIMFVPLFMQGVLGVSATKAGSTITPMMIGLMLSSIVGGRLLLKLRFRTVLTLGMAIATLGFFLMSTMDGETTILTAYSFMAVLGVGMGLVMPTLLIAVQNEFPKSQLGSVTAASTFFRSIGGTMGITILNAVMNYNLQQNMDDAVVSEKNTQVQEALKVLAAKTDNLFNIMLYPENLKMPAQVSNIIIKTIENSWIEAFSMVFVNGILFVSVGILVALSVGSGKIKRDQETEKDIA